MPIRLRQLVAVDKTGDAGDARPASPSLHRTPVRGDVYRELIHARHHAVQLDVEWYRTDYAWSLTALTVKLYV